MGKFSKLFGNRKHSDIFSDEELCEASVCPNCWGDQEYDNVVRDLPADKQIDVNNHSTRHAFIQDFVVNHVEGIQLKKGGNGMVCQKCQLKY